MWITSWVYSFIGLGYIYQDSEVIDMIKNNKEFRRISRTMEALYWISVLPLIFLFFYCMIVLCTIPCMN